MYVRVDPSCADTTHSKHKFLIGMIYRILQYLVSDLDKEGEDKNDEQVAKDANTSDHRVDDFECKVTSVEKVEKIVIFRRGRGDVVRDITRQRCVLHRC